MHSVKSAASRTLATSLAASLAASLAFTFPASARDAPEGAAAQEKIRAAIPLGGHFDPKPEEGIFVAAGHSMNVMASRDDGKTWAQVFYGAPGGDHGPWAVWNSVAYTRGVFAIASGWGAAGTVIASDDGRIGFDYTAYADVADNTTFDLTGLNSTSKDDHPTSDKPVEIATNIVAELKKLGVPARLDMFEEGGHGVGNLIPTRVKHGVPGAQWPKLLIEWLDELTKK